MFFNFPKLQPGILKSVTICNLMVNGEQLINTDKKALSLKVKREGF